MELTTTLKAKSIPLAELEPGDQFAVTTEGTVATYVCTYKASTNGFTHIIYRVQGDRNDFTMAYSDNHTVFYIFR